jgi:hypothetical protein
MLPTSFAMTPMIIREIESRAGLHFLRSIQPGHLGWVRRLALEALSLGTFSKDILGAEGILHGEHFHLGILIGHFGRAGHLARGTLSWGAFGGAFYRGIFGV